MPRRRADCPGPLDRREWLRLGGLSLGALATGASPSERALADLAGESAAAANDFSVILFWANGGPSHLETFDLKPQAPSEIRGDFRPIATNVPGIEICEHLPMLATLADKFTIVRSLHHERLEHSGGTHRFLSGYPSIAANLPDAEFPELGSNVFKQLERTQTDIPLFIANTKFYGGGPAYLGKGYSPYMPNPNPLTSSGNNVYDPVPLYRIPGTDDILTLNSEGVASLSRRRELLNSLDRLAADADRSALLRTFDGFQRQAVEMLTSERTRRAFDLSLEDEATRRRYGDTHWGKSLLTCRRLVEAGARFVQCQATYRLPDALGRTSNWDDHSVNAHIFDAYREKLPSLDRSMSAIVEDLYARGLDRRVLFIFCGEFGRTPIIRHQDPSGRPGRDHWSRAMSVFLAGGGLRMGQVIGATNARGEEPVQRAMNSNDLLATIYHRFGIDTSQLNYTTTGRPIPILAEGEPIEELV